MYFNLINIHLIFSSLKSFNLLLPVLDPIFHQMEWEFMQYKESRLMDVPRWMKLQKIIQFMAHQCVLRLWYLEEIVHLLVCQEIWHQKYKFNIYFCLLIFLIVDKVRHAQNASFDAVIVFNKDSDALEIMSASDDSDIFIPSLFVGQTSGSIIMFDYNYSRSK